MKQVVTDSAQGTAAHWGFPPPQLSSMGSCRAPAVVRRQLAALGSCQLPDWPDVSRGQACSQASLLELSQYLTKCVSPTALPEAAAVAAALPRIAHQQPSAAAVVAAAVQQLFGALLERLDGAGSVLLDGQMGSAVPVELEWLPLLPLATSGVRQHVQLVVALPATPERTQQVLNGPVPVGGSSFSWGVGAASSDGTQQQQQQQGQQEQNLQQQQSQQQQQYRQQQELSGSEVARASSKSAASSVRQAAANVLKEARELAARFNVRLA